MQFKEKEHRALLRRVDTQLRTIANDYVARPLTRVSAFIARMRDALTVGVTRALLLVLGKRALTEEEISWRDVYLQEHAFDYLDAWALEGIAREPSIVARATMYVGTLWGAAQALFTKGWDLPFYPADGSTPCLTNCRCRWTLAPGADESILTGTWIWKTAGDERRCDPCADRDNLQIRFVRGRRV